MNSSGRTDLKFVNGFPTKETAQKLYKGFTLISRLYAPLEPYFDQSWKLNDLEKVQ